MAVIVNEASFPTPEEAKAALGRLARPLSEVKARELDAATLRAAIVIWRAAIDRWHRFRYCPACGKWIEALYAAEHVTSCFAAPAVARAARAEAELRALSALVATLGLPPREIPPAPVPAKIPEYTWKHPPRDGVFRIQVVFEDEARRAVDLLAAGISAERGDAAFRENVELLEDVLAEWTIHQARARSRCEWCGSEHDLTDFADHLLSCERHPEHDRAVRMEKALASLRGDNETGIAALVESRDRYRESLRRLLTACDHLWDMMGWDDGRYKLRPLEAKPWNEAREAARAIVEAK